MYFYAIVRDDHHVLGILFCHVCNGTTFWVLKTARWTKVLNDGLTREVLCAILLTRTVNQELPRSWPGRTWISKSLDFTLHPKLPLTFVVSIFAHLTYIWHYLTWMILIYFDPKASAAVYLQVLLASGHSTRGTSPHGQLRLDGSLETGRAGHRLATESSAWLMAGWGVSFLRLLMVQDGASSKLFQNTI